MRTYSFIFYVWRPTQNGSPRAKFGQLRSFFCLADEVLSILLKK